MIIQAKEPGGDLWFTFCHFCLLSNLRPPQATLPDLSRVQAQVVGLIFVFHCTKQNVLPNFFNEISTTIEILFHLRKRIFIALKPKGKLGPVL